MAREFGTIDQALTDLKNGKIILVLDDPDRENEGDMICAAQFATTENVNMMASRAKGLICMPMSRQLCEKLALPQMVSVNTDNHSTAFTVSIDHVETTTGISAEERSITALRCVMDDAKPSDFRRPGHMFPLRARDGGVLVRGGHTEATVDLMRLAGLKECGLCCEVMKDDGTMMRKTEILELAEELDMPIDKIAEVLEMLQGACHVEQAPKTDGRIHFCLIGPPRKNSPKSQQQQQRDGVSGGIKISVS